jgi:hypothetical protein
MTTALVLHDALLDTLFAANLLCEVCEQAPWTQTGRWCPALLCAGCATCEPEPDEPLCAPPPCQGLSDHASPQYHPRFPR